MESRIETLLNALISGETITGFRPRSRAEEYLLAAVNKSGTEGLPNPQSRLDALLFIVAKHADNVRYSAIVQDLVEGTVVKLEIPEGVNTIGPYAFYNQTNLEEVIIPEGVTSIETYAFSSCSNLSKITIPKTLISVATKAFSYANKLSEVYISDLKSYCRITFTGSDCVPTCKGAKLYLNGELVEELVIPEDITEIPDNTFNGCSSIKSIIYHDGVKSIGNGAFAASSVEYAVLKKGITYGSAVFYNCQSLETAVIDDGVTTIPDSAFRWCDSLKNVTIPEGITVIPDSCFQRASFETLILPSTLKTITSYSLCDCASLKSISLPDGLKTIGNQGFSKSGIESITIPDSVTSLSSQRIFESCKSLVSATVGTGVTNLGPSLFAYCSALETVVFNGNVTTVGSSVFSSCTALKNVTFKSLKITSSNLSFTSSNELTVESMVGILEACLDNTGGTKYTIKFGSTNLAKLTAEQKAIATSKNISLQ